MTTTLIVEKQEDFAGLQLNAQQLKLGSTVFQASDLAAAGGLSPVFTDVDAGASGTAGTVDVFPTTASKGKVRLSAADSAADYTTTIVNASQAASRTYTIPDAGGAASFVMTEGAQTVNGIKTLGSAPVLPSGGLSANGTAVTSTEIAVLASAAASNAGTSKAVILGTSGAVTIAGAMTTTVATVPTGGIGAAGGFAVRASTFCTGSTSALNSTDGNDSTPVATEVYYAEVFVGANCTLTGVAVFNGSVASGNIKVGLANSSGVNVATSASTAMSGTDAYQRVPFTGTYAAVGPATYYVELFVDNNTARVNTFPIGTFVAGKQTGQTYATGFTTITPGTTFTANLGPIATLY